MLNETSSPGAKPCLASPRLIAVLDWLVGRDGESALRAAVGVPAATMAFHSDKRRSDSFLSWLLRSLRDSSPLSTARAFSAWAAVSRRVRDGKKIGMLMGRRRDHAGFVFSSASAGSPAAMSTL